MPESLSLYLIVLLLAFAFGIFITWGLVIGISWLNGPMATGAVLGPVSKADEGNA